MFLRTLTVSLLLIGTIGCSTMMSKPEPREMWPKLEYTSCTSSKAAPFFDGIGGGLLLGWGIVGIAVGNAASFLDVFVGGLLAWSSVEGTENAETCSQLKTYLATDRTNDDEQRSQKQELQLEKQKLEFERMKLELEREKLELQKLREQNRK